MADIDDILVDALRARQTEQLDASGNPPKLIWNNETLPCVAGSTKIGKELGLGGWGWQYELILIIAMADFPDSIPVAKQTLTYPAANGLLYRIMETTVPPGSSFIALGLVQATKGA